jgi:hypothetical protein
VSLFCWYIEKQAFYEMQCNVPHGFKKKKKKKKTSASKTLKQHTARNDEDQGISEMKTKGNCKQWMK